MKKLLILILFSIPTIVLAQSTYTVDNKPNAKADFDDLQTAINTVAAGSTLLVSSGSYNNVTIEKRIIIKGTGYFLTENPNTHADPVSSIVSGITFKKGSEGSVISGISSNGFAFSESVSNISFVRNYVRTIGFYNTPANRGIEVTNINIFHNYIYGERRYSSSSSSSYDYSIRVGSGSLIEGNYITSSNLVKGSYLTIRNNVLWNGLPIGIGFRSQGSDISKSTISNNIFRLGSFFINNDDWENNIKNNIFFHTSVTSPTADDNDNKLTNTNPFIEDTDDRYSTDGRYILSSGSQAKGAGVGGIDCGMFYEIDGKDAGYRLSGLPDIPNIYEFNVPTTGYSNSTGLQINVKVKSNN
ncbi:hypothetical protein [uncultured Polaribacter sp.]|uniref:hypothetical protein n=1 Tax=uncultured Polaribacter sp. TaxID=174711 RepID=UPI0026241329|nr:hypothetical protein [uncultured Polaribacter sp.]